MPVIIRSTKFKKAIKALSFKMQEKVMEKLQILMENEFEPSLNNHSLHGEYSGFRSINITGDFRIIYKKVDDDICQLYDAGSHSKLFG